MDKYASFVGGYIAAAAPGKTSGKMGGGGRCFGTRVKDL